MLARVLGVARSCYNVRSRYRHSRGRSGCASLAPGSHGGRGPGHTTQATNNGAGHHTHGTQQAPEPGTRGHAPKPAPEGLSCQACLRAKVGGDVLTGSRRPPPCPGQCVRPAHAATKAQHATDTSARHHAQRAEHAPNASTRGDATEAAAEGASCKSQLLSARTTTQPLHYLRAGLPVRVGLVPKVAGESVVPPLCLIAALCHEPAATQRDRLATGAKEHRGVCDPMRGIPGKRPYSLNPPRHDIHLAKGHGRQRAPARGVRAGGRILLHPLCPGVLGHVGGYPPAGGSVVSTREWLCPRGDPGVLLGHPGLVALKRLYYREPLVQPADVHARDSAGPEPRPRPLDRTPRL